MMMGMGPQMMNSGMGMGQGMMGGMMNSGMSTGQQMSSMAGMSAGQPMGSMAGMSSGSIFNSVFSLIINGLLVLAVIALFVGIIGFGYSYIKKNFLTKPEAKVEAETESPQIVVNP